MALALRLRRVVAVSGSLLKDLPFSPISASSPLPTPLSKPFVATPLLGNPSIWPHSRIQSLSFRSMPPSSNRRSDFGRESDIKPEDILFEGCDYNHWLITMDFPKDPKPTPEEMVETYVQTLAKVVGSVEEAKKAMYACSTTTYTGFQAVMTEEMSEKFKGLPGVVFILPDSYIDPVNKQYGGDKYDNGVITPRPPPVQYGRGGRFVNRNRNDERPRFERQREPMSTQGGQPPQDRWSSTQGDGRNYAPPQQNYGQSGQDGRGYAPQRGREFAPPGESRDFGQGQQRDYAQTGGRDYVAGGRDGYRGEPRDPMPSYQREFSQGQRGNFAPQEQRNFSQGQGGDYRYSGPPGSGDYRQGSGPGANVDYRQGSGSGYGGEYRQGPNPGYNMDNRQEPGSGYGGDYRQGSGSGGHNYPGRVEGQTESWQGKN